MSSSEDWTDDEDEDESIAINSKNRRRVPAAGRRNIREIKRLHELENATRIAHYEEISRKMRIADYERDMAQLFPNGEAKQRMILDFDPVTKEPTVVVDPLLVQHLKEHQKEGISYMWKVCFERVSRIKEDPGTGCILAHCMGLGKTLQAIALVHTVLTNPLINLRKVLILAPKNIIMNWEHELKKWIRPPMKEFRIYNPASNVHFKTQDIENWDRSGGVCVLSYTKFRLLQAEKKQELEKYLIDPGPDLLVCDEGHVLKTKQTKLSKAFAKLKTRRRIILSGTPLQNHLIEYYCMVNFVRPHLLGTKAEFSNMFQNPIQNGQYHDSDAEDVDRMKARSFVLHKTLQSCVQRFDITTLKPFLQEKKEFVLFVRLTSGQIDAYSHYLNEIKGAGWLSSFRKEQCVKLFADFQSFQRIWTHPYSMQIYDDNPPPPPKKKAVDSDDDSYDERPRFWIPGWWREFFTPEEMQNKDVSAKLTILFEIIQYCYEHQEKLLIFSQSLYSLKLIEHFLNKGWDDGRAGWERDEDYFVLTGSSTAQERDEMCMTFNSPRGKNIHVFLISTKAGGLGITLNAANRAVIFDACWNPSHDVQSIFRIYRLGQKKPCFIYRLIAAGTMEEKIYVRQVAKISTAHRVLDEKQIARHYTANELLELYEFQPDKKYRNPDILRKDDLLEKIVRKHSEMVGGYHEHDSLLQHKLDEEMLEDEKKFALTNFNEDKSILDGATAIGKMLTRNTFREDNFKIVLRRRHPHLSESAISDLVAKLMPRVEAVFAAPNCASLMAQQAIKATIMEQSKPGSLPQKSGQPLREWGRFGDRTFGPAEPDSD